MTIGRWVQRKCFGQSCETPLRAHFLRLQCIVALLLAAAGEGVSPSESGGADWFLKSGDFHGRRLGGTAARLIPFDEKWESRLGEFYMSNICGRQNKAEAKKEGFF